MCDPVDEHWIRQSLVLAQLARDRGDHPFGALLADSDGKLIVEEMNSVVTGNDITGHAETNLVRAAWRRREDVDLSSSTMYTSAEPCAMCSGSIYWSGIGRVVFGLRESTLAAITGDDVKNPTMHLPAERVLNSGQRTIELVGPLLEDEAAAVHENFWRMP